MKKLLFFVVSVFLAGSVFAQKTVINDPNAEIRNVKGFHAIQVSHAII